MTYLFGVRRGPAPTKRVSAQLDAIAEEYGCELRVGDGQTWWSGPNRGEPWDSRLRDDVAAACVERSLGEWCPGARPGRPLTREEPIDRQIAIKVTERQRAGLDARAEARGVTLGVVVRDAIDRYLESE